VVIYLVPEAGATVPESLFQKLQIVVCSPALAYQRMGLPGSSSPIGQALMGM